MNQGKVVQIIGAVVDVEFPRSEVPKIYDALKIANTEITLEVQQQLGDAIYRQPTPLIVVGSAGQRQDRTDP